MPFNQLPPSQHFASFQQPSQPPQFIDAPPPQLFQQLPLSSSQQPIATSEQSIYSQSIAPQNGTHQKQDNEPILIQQQTELIGESNALTTLVTSVPPPMRQQAELPGFAPTSQPPPQISQPPPIDMSVPPPVFSTSMPPPSIGVDPQLSPVSAFRNSLKTSSLLG
jgi:hypothetical protein